MADRYITDLPAATSIQDTDALLVDQSNVARMITGALLKNYINRNILTISVQTVPSTSDAGVVSYNSVTGELVLAIPRGVGFPSGGTAGQVLAKNSATDYDTEWVDQESGLPTGGTTGQVLAKTSNADYAVGWVNQSGGSGLPSVTSADNGKVLMVVNGAWDKAELQSATGVSF